MALTFQEFVEHPDFEYLRVRRYGASFTASFGYYVDGRMLSTNKTGVQIPGNVTHFQVTAESAKSIVNKILWRLSTAKADIAETPEEQNAEDSI